MNGTNEERSGYVTLNSQLHPSQFQVSSKAHFSDTSNLCPSLKETKFQNHKH